MLRNYLKIAVRNLLRHRLYSLLNVLGLAVGLTVCTLILLWVQDELGYDRFHEHADRIHRVTVEIASADGPMEAPVAAGAIGPTLREDLPEVEAAARLWRVGGNTLIGAGEKRFYEDRFYWADPELFDVFTLPLRRGNPQTALTAPNGVVITGEIAQKYFPDEDPIGKMIRVGDAEEYQVTGLLEEIPANSHIRFDFLGSASSTRIDEQLDEQAFLARWTAVRYRTYLKLREGSDPAPVEARLNEIVDENVGEILKQFGVGFFYKLQPLTDIHLRSHLMGEVGVNGDIAYVYAFAAIGLFVLLIACINFTNLATARSAGRAREVGVRKVAGAHRRQLVGQFLGESLLICSLALLVTLALIELLLPLFNDLAGKELRLEYASNAWILLAMAGMTLVTGLAAGSYPAFFLSAFEPASVLKGTGPPAIRKARFRSVLVVAQFAISIGLIVGTLIISAQIDYMRSKELGFDEENVVTVPLRTDEMRGNWEALRADLLRNPDVLGVGACSDLPGRVGNRRSLWKKGAPQEEVLILAVMQVDYDFVRTTEIEMVEGRGFSREFGTDANGAYLVNQAATKLLGEGSAVGKEIGEPDNEQPELGDFSPILGVVKDFHFTSLHVPIEPLALELVADAQGVAGSFEYLAVRIRPGDIPNILASLEEIWNRHAGAAPFEYAFLDEELDELYKADERLGKVLRIFAGLAIAIACLGLFGLASFTAEQRTKEIGIRKVLGASVGNIVLLLSREFTWLVVAANIVAWPAAYFGMREWLQGFAYRVELGPGLFILGGVAALAVAWLTVSWQAVRAAMGNPVDALKYE
jgi:putative ABC transport system permease protein